MCEARSRLFHASPPSASLRFTFLKLFSYIQSAVRVLYLVRVLYPVRSPWSSVHSHRFILTATIITFCEKSSKNMLFTRELS